MEKAEGQMKSSTSAFMTVQLATREVFGVAREVKYSERFSMKGPSDVRCMFWTKAFDSKEMKKRHILSYHWKAVEVCLSIYTECFKFLYEIEIESVYVYASIFGFSYIIKYFTLCKM